MKTLTKKESKNVKNAWGGYADVYYQNFEIEQSDVGQVKPNYLGYRHKDYKITGNDVGKTVCVMSDGTGWNCWSFV